MNKAKIRVTATLPTGVLVFRSVNFEWEKGTPVDLKTPMVPLVEWVFEEFREWLA